MKRQRGDEHVASNFGALARLRAPGPTMPVSKSPRELVGKVGHGSEKRIDAESLIETCTEAGRWRPAQE